MGRGLLFAYIVVFSLLGAPAAQAASEGGAFEFSVGLSYNRSNYTAENYSWSRRYGASIGYHFSERSGVEFSFQDAYERTYIANYQDTTFQDQIYGLSWIQAVTGRNAPVQPYLKVGAGQLNRDASGSYANGAAPASRVDSLTGILGLGLRLYLSRGFAIRGEVTSYLQGAQISTWQDNISATAGVSVYF
jgi:hypothetical protein